MSVGSYSVVLSGFLLAMGFARCSSNHSNEVEMRLSRLKQIEMKFDATSLPPQKREMLKILVEAGKLIHEAYLRQNDPTGVQVRDSLQSKSDKRNNDLLRLVIRNGGRFDKMDEMKNFVGNEPKSLGAGFYPPNLTKEEWKKYLTSHPEVKSEFESPYSIIRRKDGGLEAIPFHVAYKEWIEPAAELIRKASTLAENVSLKKYLEARADALLTDNYYPSDIAWIDVDSDIDVLLSPDEIYDDGLLGIKASYEVSIMVRDSAASARLTIYTHHLRELEQQLPIEQKFKKQSVGLSSPMEIVTDMFRGGDIATGYQAVAATLPNDVAARMNKGSKKIFWKNMMDARVNHIILSIGRELIASDQIHYVTADAMFNDVLVHELCHALGPVYVFGSASVAVNSALAEHYTTIEEAKADVVGLHSIRYFIENGIMPVGSERAHYVSYLASIFRSIRFGTSEAHGQAALCELQYLTDRGAIRLDRPTKKWSVVFDKMPYAISALAGELLMLESNGSYERAAKFIGRWGKASNEIEEAVSRLSHLPVDIDPVYTVKWE